MSQSFMLSRSFQGPEAGGAGALRHEGAGGRPAELQRLPHQRQEEARQRHPPDTGKVWFLITIPENESIHSFMSMSNFRPTSTT